MLSAFPGKLGYYSKGTTPDHYEAVTDERWAGMGYDHRFNISKVLGRTRTGFVQGNFDQALLFSDPGKFKNVLSEYLSEIKDLSPEQRRGWVCGLGHGVLPKTPEENVRSFVRIVRESL